MRAEGNLGPRVAGFAGCGVHPIHPRVRPLRRRRGPYPHLLPAGDCGGRVWRRCRLLHTRRCAGSCDLTARDSFFGGD
ncbi:unnamed protein product, partial [Ectocarpus sp. 12 AP-2014]